MAVTTVVMASNERQGSHFHFDWSRDNFSSTLANFRFEGNAWPVPQQRQKLPTATMANNMVAALRGMLPITPLDEDIFSVDEANLLRKEMAKLAVDSDVVVYVKIHGRRKVCVRDDKSMVKVARAVYASILKTDERQLLELPCSQFRKWIFRVGDLSAFNPTIYEWCTTQLIMQEDGVAFPKDLSNIRWNYIMRLGYLILQKYQLMLRRKMKSSPALITTTAETSSSNTGQENPKPDALPPFPEVGGRTSAIISATGLRPSVVTLLKDLDDLLKSEQEKFMDIVTEVGAKHQGSAMHTNVGAVMFLYHGEMEMLAWNKLCAQLGGRKWGKYAEHLKEALTGVVVQVFPSLSDHHIETLSIQAQYGPASPQPIHSDSFKGPRAEPPDVTATVMVSESGPMTVVLPSAKFPMPPSAGELARLEDFAGAPVGLLDRIIASECFQRYPRLLFASALDLPNPAIGHRGDILLFHGYEPHYGPAFSPQTPSTGAFDSIDETKQPARKKHRPAPTKGKAAVQNTTRFVLSFTLKKEGGSDPYHGDSQCTKERLVALLVNEMEEDLNESQKRFMMNLLKRYLQQSYDNGANDRTLVGKEGQIKAHILHAVGKLRASIQHQAEAEMSMLNTI